MSNPNTPTPIYLSAPTGKSVRLSVLLISSFVLAGCGDDKAPTVEWFVDNPSEIYRTLRSCNNSTRYNPMPHHTWCANARFASETRSMRLSIREEEKNLEDAINTPENLRTIQWYERNRHARQAKLKECKISIGNGDVEFDPACFKATRAGMNLYVRGGADAFSGETMSELTRILRAISPLPTPVPPDIRQHREARGIALEQAVPAGKSLPGLEPVVLHKRVVKEVAPPPLAIEHKPLTP
ncbi:EexN family lipoprotein [Pseudomonas sp. MDT2-39-1]